jgi:hypothetical protein
MMVRQTKIQGRRSSQLAKETTTLERLGGGRLILGVVLGTVSNRELKHLAHSQMFIGRVEDPHCGAG